MESRVGGSGRCSSLAGITVVAGDFNHPMAGLKSSPVCVGSVISHVTSPSFL